MKRKNSTQPIIKNQPISMLCTQCHKSFRKKISSLTAVINNTPHNFCSDICYARYCFKNKCKYDRNQTYHRVQKETLFRHISSYSSFNDFKEAIIHFLKTISFNDLKKYSDQIAFHVGLEGDAQKVQIKAINKVFNQLYGKDKVRWGYIYIVEDNQVGFWGPYLIKDEVTHCYYPKSNLMIDEVTYFYYPEDKDVLDKFIKKRLKNGNQRIST